MKAGLKADGTLKKGYRYAKGGRIVKSGCTTTAVGKVCSVRNAKRKPSKKAATERLVKRRIKATQGLLF
jgi:hypothetical protein